MSSAVIAERYAVAWLWWLVIAWGLSACSSIPEPPSDRQLDPSQNPDAVPKLEPKSRYGNPQTYTVNGVLYHTLPSALGYKERGIASWYGPGFHGRLTSNREPYNMYAMTAAHKTLPLPCYVRVTNLNNGRRVILRVNDRGPFHDNRIIDLTYSAATRLDILRKGTGLVEVEAIDPENFTPDPAPTLVTNNAALRNVSSTTEPRLFLQVGAFGSRLNAERLAARLSPTVNTAVRVRAVLRDPVPMYRVQLGPLDSVEAADGLNDTLRRQGLADTQIVVE